MLGKTIKYESRASARLLLPFFGLVLALCALLRGLQFVTGKISAPAGAIVASFAQGLGAILLVALIGITFVYALVRFWQSMLGDEATLTFSLPVGASVHIWGRFITATLFVLAGCVVALGGLFLLVPDVPGLLQSISLAGGLTLADLPGSLLGSVWGLFLFTLVLAIVTNLFQFYAAFALGSQIGRDKILGSILAYFGLNLVQAVLTVPALLVPIARIGFSNAEFEAYLTGLITSDAVVSMQNIVNTLWWFMGYIAVVSLVFMVAHIVITQVCFSRRLNLE